MKEETVNIRMLLAALLSTTTPVPVHLETLRVVAQMTLDLLVVKALSISHTSLVSPTCTSPKDVKKAAVLTMLNKHI